MILHVPTHSFPTRRSSDLFARIQQRDLPLLRLTMVYFERIVAGVDGEIGVHQMIIERPVLYDMALVATADDEFVDSGRSIQLHDVPENGAPAAFDHRLGSAAAFFADARAVTAG